MATSNDGSSSVEEREAPETTPATFPATPAPLPPSSIEIIMVRLAQQDAAQKGTTDQIMALCKNLSSSRCERGSLNGVVPKTSV